jgi:hypothetical protein
VLFLAGRSVGADAVAGDQPREFAWQICIADQQFSGPVMRSGWNVENRTDNSALTAVGARLMSSGAKRTAARPRLASACIGGA